MLFGKYQLMIHNYLRNIYYKEFSNISEKDFIFEKRILHIKITF